MQGTLNEWQRIGGLSLRGGSILVIDAYYVPFEFDGEVVELPLGNYEVEVRLIDYGGDVRVAQLRAYRAGTDPMVGEQLGETWTETATLGLCDLEVFLETWDGWPTDPYKAIEGDLETRALFGTAVLDEEAGAVMPFVSSGFGDGVYPLFELVADAERVGLLVVFIGEDEEYPF